MKTHLQQMEKGYNLSKIHEKIHYIQMSPLLTYAGISSAVQLLILALAVSFQKTGLLLTNTELSELLNTTERNIQKAISALGEKDVLENQGNKHNRKLVVKYEQLCALITNNLARHYEQSFVLGVNDCTLSHERLFTFLYKEESKLNNNTKSKVKQTAFYPPSLDEVQSYITEKKYDVDALKFIEYYSKTGWKDKNGNLVKNWKQKLLTVWVKSSDHGKTTTTSQRQREDFASQQSSVGHTVNI